jgi:type II secretory pathway pseudopilin PulG
MVQITIEYMILTPVLIMLIFLLPFVASSIMGTYSNSRQTLELQSIAGHLGSTIQQVYFSLNHDSIPVGIVTVNTGIPPLLEGYTYSVNATSKTATASGATVVNFVLKLSGSGISTNASVTLGQGVTWVDSYFWSNSVNATIVANKLSINNIQISITS